MLTSVNRMKIGDGSTGEKKEIEIGDEDTQRKR
jgi:hypothetical protein